MTLHELIEQNYHKLSDNDLHIWQYISANECKQQYRSKYCTAKLLNFLHHTRSSRPFSYPIQVAA